MAHVFHSKVDNWAVQCFPSEEFELTANSLSTHIETHRKVILRTLRYLTLNSQDDLHCDLAASFQ